MIQVLHAFFDGEVFHPEEKTELAPNTRVKVTIEKEEENHSSPASFLQTARTLHLTGPSDWSENLEDYLYNGKSDHA